MQPIKYGKMLLVVAVLLQNVFAAKYTVSQDGTANFTTIQAAVNAAHPDDEIEILDVGIYKEQVTIDSTKHGLYLHSTSPKLLQKPTIKFQDTKNVNPKTAAEAKSDATINFDRNGALQVLGAKRVRIEGIAVDGDEPYVFGYDAIWDDGGQKWPLQHGNGGITLWIAGDCIIRYCDISNCFFGINVKDRNIGGVFANPNPADIDSLDIVPFSGFAQTGNHVFELNRIHNNSFGMYFESSWDLGSTIRYNLFYENHHVTSSFAAKVKGLTSEGNNMPGGAIMTKDDLLSPLAIYNNTFWHNYLIFVGIWKAGGQHLIFNNIYSSPYVLYSKEEVFQGATSLDMMKSYANRMHNCVIAAQAQISNSYVSITNDFSQPKAEGDVTTKPFPASAEIVYLETSDRFISTSPSSPDFLVPDFSDPMVQKYIIDQGWEASGVRDPDATGSRADLGAIPVLGGQYQNIAVIRPAVPVIVNGTKATITLSVIPRLGEINNPKFTMAGVVTNLDTSDVFGSAYKPISLNNIQKINVGAVTLKEGSNTFDVTIPASLGDFAFFEFIVEGTDKDNFPYTSAVGFIPYRKLDYYLKVTVQDIGKTKTLTEVKAGTPVNLHIEAFKAGGTAVKSAIDPLALNLGSAYDLYDEAGNKIDTLRDRMPQGVGDITAVFHKVPVGGIDQVLAAGKNKDLPFLGASDDIKILPGDPDNVKWQDPAHLMSKVIATGVPTPALAKVFDKYDNLITAPPVTVHAVSTKPDIGDIINPDYETDVTGTVTFLALVNNGNKNDTFPIVATLPSTGKSDTAFLVVGDAKDIFRIFYSDTAAYDSTVELRGCSGDRFPIVVRAVKSGSGVMSADKDNDFTITTSSGINVYADETSTTPITSSKLVKGEVRLWIQGASRNVTNGKIEIQQVGGNVNRGERSKIYFDACLNSIDKAIYYADNGVGSVNKLEIFYHKPLAVEEIPDSFDLYWPVRANDSKIVVKKDAVTQDPNDSAHLLVTINPPFPPGITKINGSALLGTSYWFNTKTPEAPVNKEDFNIIDGVGPLIATATLLERLEAGNDTILVSFTENVTPDVVTGITLYLIKKGTTTPVEMNVLSALPGPQGTTVKVITNMVPNPEVDDSLKIIPTGTIVDGAGNHAHELNRPVPIVLKPVPADIADAVYLDENADGQIDKVKIAFKKNVDPNQTAIQLRWENTKQILSDFTGAALTMIGTDTVVITIADTTFGFDKKLLNKTSGNMDVTATFYFFTEDNTRSAKVRDGAAPVIDSMEYHKGMYLENNTVAEDTLFVRYTEELEAGLPNPDPKQPVNFERNGVITPITYDATKDLGITQNQFHRFIVASDQAVKPITGDSGWIKVDGINDPSKNATDLYSNVQKNEANRRVLIKVFKPKFDLYVAAGPKPCDPNDPDVNNRKIKIVMSPPPKITETISTTFKVTLNFYDKVGNLVKSFPKDILPNEMEYEVVNGYIVANNAFDIKWDCTNSKHRIVGSGTYVCIIKGTYETGEGADKEEFVIDQKVLLGVQAKK